MNIPVNKVIVEYLAEQAVMFDNTTQANINILLGKRKEDNNGKFLYNKGTIDDLKDIFGIKNMAFFYSSFKPQGSLYGDNRLKFRNREDENALSEGDAKQLAIALDKRDVFLNSLEEAEEELIDFRSTLCKFNLDSITPKDKPEVIAESLHRAFVSFVNDDTIHDVKADIYYEKLSYFLENLGVLIFLVDSSSTIKANGVYINCSSYPIILVKNAYSYKRNNFTLLHEFAHLLLSRQEETGLNNSQEHRQLFYSNTNEEVWANQFASAFLIPHNDELLKKHYSKISDFNKTTIASKYVLLFRLYSLNKITEDTKEQFYKEMCDKDEKERAKYKNKTDNKPRGSSRSKNEIIHKAGIYSTQKLLLMRSRNKIYDSTLYNFLGIKVALKLSSFYRYYGEVSF